MAKKRKSSEKSSTSAPAAAAAKPGAQSPSEQDRPASGKKKKHKKDRRTAATPDTQASSAPAPASDGIALGAAPRRPPTPTSGDGKKAGMSSALLNMKFMQRNKAAPAAAPAAAAPAPAAGAAPAAAAARPEPRLFGRRSFGGFNPHVDEAEAAFYRSFGAYVAPRKLNDDDEDMVARFGEYVGGRKKGRSAGGGEAKKKRRS
jgi:hypothetical protein